MLTVKCKQKPFTGGHVIELLTFKQPIDLVNRACMHNDNKDLPKLPKLPKCAYTKRELNQTTVSVSPCHQQTSIAGLASKED
jgi:hypothetical protein